MKSKTVEIGRLARELGSKGGAIAFGLGALGVAMGSTYGADLDYGVGYIGEYHSNMTRVAHDATDARSDSAFAGFAYRDTGPRLATAVVAQSEYRAYRPDIYQDGAIHYLDAAGLWIISPRQFTWNVADRYDYGILDATQPYTPTNRTSFNAFETGPDFFAHLDGANTVSVGARYGRVRYGEIGASDRRSRGIARWFYQTGSLTTWSLNHITREIRYDDNVENDNSRRNDSFVRYDDREGRTQLVMDAGYSSVDRERGEDVSGFVGSLALAREISSESRMSLVVINQLTDSGSAALDSVTSPVETTSGPTRFSNLTVATGDIFRNRAAEWAYHRIGSVLTTNIGLFIRDVDYQSTEQDRRENGGSVEFIHGVSETLSSRVFGSRSKARNWDAHQDDDTTEYGVGLTYRATEHLRVSLDGRRTRRRSTNANLGYVDDSATVTVLYGSSPAYVPAPRR